tara:strand:- start:2075 stop:2551 length:477 start_codon:yes stop_codon:yes gene_type:complete
MAGRHLPRIATPGRTSFKGPIRQGLNTGIPDTISIGETILSQRADISAAETSATTVFVLPSDNEGGAVRSDIISIDVMVDVIFEDSAQAVIEFALLSAGGTSLGEVRVSGAGTYSITPGSAATGWYAVTGQNIVAQVSAAGTSPDTGHAFLLLQYAPR